MDPREKSGMVRPVGTRKQAQEQPAAQNWRWRDLNYERQEDADPESRKTYVDHVASVAVEADVPGATEADAERLSRQLTPEALSFISREQEAGAFERELDDDVTHAAHDFLDIESLKVANHDAYEHDGVLTIVWNVKGRPGEEYLDALWEREELARDPHRFYGVNPRDFI